MRSRAGFCPQCGTPVKTEESLAATSPAVELQETLPGLGEEVLAAATTATIASEGAVKASGVEEEAEQPARAEPAPVLIEEREAAGAVALADEGESAAAATDTTAQAGEEPAQPTRRHRVKVAAMDAVEGKIAPRVEKLRHASTVVLDEAADDPGLRFVLVAAVLILLSLGLLLLSQILD